MSAPGADALRAHLLGELLPFWRERGVDAEGGGFVSQLDASGRPCLDEPRRLLVQTRQVWVFSLGALAGGDRWMGELADAGSAALLRDYWDEEHGGFWLTTTPEGAPLDRSKDLYAHAFVLLALAARDACGDPRALPLARRTLSLLDEHLADERAGGYLESADADWTLRDGPRRQNPHMHLFEAALALAEREPEGPWTALARRLLELLETRFADAQGGILREYFAPDWAPAGDESGRITEPGHHFEWTWLLCEYARVAGDERPLALAERLFERASAAGIDPEHGGVFDRVDTDGAVLRDSKRLWPQTEYLKALAVRGDRERLAAELERCWSRYRDPKSPGWIEHLARDGTPLSERMNATSVYHVWTALSAVAAAL